MRSAETSGVEGKGFGLFRNRSLRLGTWYVNLADRFHRIAAAASPTTIAIAVTALCAAGLSVIVDTARTLDEDRSRRQLIAHVAAAQPAAEWLADPILPMDMTAPASSLDGVWMRGAGAFGAAFLAIGLTFRRRDPAGQAVADGAGSLGELLATIPFGVACWTQEGVLLDCNEHYRARLDGDGADVHPGASYHASIRHLIHGGYMRFLTENEGNRVLELHRRDGSCLLIDERPLPSGGFVTLVTDVTERRQADRLLASIREEQRLLARRYHEEKLRAEAASRSKTSFLAHLSHDIRTPLNHIIGFAEMMRQETYGPLGDSRYVNYAEAMRESGERLLGFFAATLELAELESGRKVLRTEPFTVEELLRNVSRRFAAQAQRARITLTMGAPCDARLLGDRFSLERMLGNLIENSLRFTPAGGRITLAAFAAADGVVLEVTDTGIGMGEERLAALSQPFAFGDATFTREHNGAGLGIAIARAIAELSGGRLAIDSRPALGTTVAISLPLLAEEEARAA